MSRDHLLGWTGNTENFSLGKVVKKEEKKPLVEDNTGLVLTYRGKSTTYQFDYRSPLGAIYEFQNLLEEFIQIAARECGVPVEHFHKPLKPLPAVENWNRGAPLKEGKYTSRWINYIGWREEGEEREFKNNQWHCWVSGKALGLDVTELIEWKPSFQTTSCLDKRTKF